LKIAKVGRWGCAKRTASWREWVVQKAIRSGLQMSSFMLAMKMESPASYQGAKVAERLQKKARRGQAELLRDFKWCHCWE